MSDEIFPEPQPRGSLVPPPRNPPTALATAAPLPPRRQDPDDLAPVPGFRRFVDAALDRLDLVGDRVAAAIGLR